MRLIKRGFAITMALLLMISAQPMAAEKSSPKILEEKEIAEGVNAGKKATPSNAKRAVTKPEEEIKFNTGNHVYSVVSKEDFFEHEFGDAFFEEDGSYTINIPEPNPFFPYEVEFTYDGKETRKWFMSPDDCVEINGHSFYVSAYFDGTAVTQMSLNVGGDTVIAYPEKKKFTDEETEKAEPMSLLPLETRELNIDLSDYTPVELTMVSVNEIFAGNTLMDGDKVIWTINDYSQDDYTISFPGDKIDLSHETTASSSLWKMIIGDDNQLASDNICYMINITLENSEDWLIPTVYTQDIEGNRIKRGVLRNTCYYDYYYENGRELLIEVSSKNGNWENDEQAYVCLEINDDIFSNTRYDHFKVYEGNFNSILEAETEIDITEKLFYVDMTQTDAGYLLKEGEEKYITIITFDEEGNVTGCLPFYLHLYLEQNFITCHNLKSELTNAVGHSTVVNVVDKSESSSHVIAAYIGHYSSMEEAIIAGSEDIKKELFGFLKGYGTDYSNGVFFTIFIGEDEKNSEEIYYYFFKTEEGLTIKQPMSVDAYISFYGLCNRDGKSIAKYISDVDDDSYSENNYITILVDEETDLTYLAPQFNLSSDSILYVKGSSTPEISSKSYHDFSKGAVQYMISAQNGASSKNIWLQVVKAGVGNGTLFISSLTDEKANTISENGITYSTHEIFINTYYDYHDILLINTGETSIPSISVELISDEVELDDYWTLNGDYELSGTNNGERYDDLRNLAKIRIKPKNGIADRKEISGTLTIKSGENTLIVLTLTGIIGDPCITTEEIPKAIKYAPYDTIIQNNNQCSWNNVKYKLKDGNLPDGIELKENGELYGVPTETGKFTFTVRMENSYEDFPSSEKTFTLTVIDNTDADIESATDEGYELIQRIPTIDVNVDSDQTVISKGDYEEFVDVFLDGEKLRRDIDYTAESGSTKITIRSETLKAHNTVGKHTLGIEFRTKGTGLLKRAVQNYEVKAKNQNNNSSSSGSSSGGSSTSKRRKSDNTAAASTMFYDTKKGYMNDQGIILGEGEGYSKWQQDEQGRKLIYADGTTAGGYITELPDGAAAEQVLWEQINGTWYAFGASGYAKSGWVYDCQLNCWYCATADYGVYFGWYRDPLDNCVYYLEPGTGRISIGWKYIDEKWYYFNENSLTPTWKFNIATGEWLYDNLDNHKPYGSMYSNELTPDGYFVGTDGVWDEKGSR